MTIMNSISTTLRLTINTGIIENKKITKTISITNISKTASADTLATVAVVLGKLLEFPVIAVKKYSTSYISSSPEQSSFMSTAISEKGGFCVKTILLKFTSESSKTFNLRLNYAGQALASEKGKELIQNAVAVILELQPFSETLVSFSGAELTERTVLKII